MKYFRWIDAREKNNCFLIGLGGEKVAGELRRGERLAAQRTKPYLCSMDDEYPRNVRLTDHLVNDEDVIIASPRLRDFLVERLGDTIELLSINIEDHKRRLATKDYSIINLLDRQDCLVVEQSMPLYAPIDGKQVLTGVHNLTIDPKKISPDSQLFRMEKLNKPILVREDLVAEIKAKKFDGVRLNAVHEI